MLLTGKSTVRVSHGHSSTSVSSSSHMNTLLCRTIMRNNHIDDEKYQLPEITPAVVWQMEINIFSCFLFVFWMVKSPKEDNSCAERSDQS